MAKVGSRPKSLTRRELRQLLKNTPLPRSIAASTQQPTPPTLESRSSSSIYLDAPKPVSRRLLPHSKKAGGRHKPILVLDAASPPRRRRTTVLAAAYKHRRSQDEDVIAIHDLLKTLQDRVQQTAADLKEKKAELAKCQAQTTPSVSAVYLATPVATPATRSLPVASAQQLKEATPPFVLRTPDYTPAPSLSTVDALSPVPPVATIPALASDDPFISQSKNLASASSYIRSRSSAALEGKPASRSNDAGSRIPRPASHAARLMLATESPIRAPDTPVPARPIASRLLVSLGNKTGTPPKKGPSRVKVPTISTSKPEKGLETVGNISAPSGVHSMGAVGSLSAGAGSRASPTIPQEADSKRRSISSPKVTIALEHMSSNSLSGRVRRSAIAHQIPVPLSNKPAPITASYYEKENLQYDKGGLARSKSTFGYYAGPAKAATIKPPPMFPLSSSGHLKRPSLVTRKKHLVDTRVIPVKSPDLSMDSSTGNGGTERKKANIAAIEALDLSPCVTSSSSDALKSETGFATPNGRNLEAASFASEVGPQGSCATLGIGLDNNPVNPNTTRATGFRGFIRMVGEILSSPWRTRQG